jgi:hypothetical protein
MKRIEAQFRPRWRPGRVLLATLSVAAVCAVLAVAGALWEWHRVNTLRAQIAQLVEDERAGLRPPVPRVIPPYEASARQFLRERSAGWAPMFRTLENASMIGVTPSAVEFDAADGTARAELNYSDSAALFDYLGRLNEGVAPAAGVARWSLIQTRAQPGGSAGNNGIAGAMTSGGMTGSSASIRSTWLEQSQ